MAYGAFVSSFINFILLALCVFAIIKALNTAKDRFKKEEAVEEAAPVKSDEVVLLEEIRDLLKKNA
ncbi:MscL family protein [Sharpea azabuensis]|uniref:MscL family protein n=1 Tax=Sharpea azabuensis TaxID=322505 RepID=UPI0023F53C92|nr:MscL family protein [Sharpea azabuensis]